jgi:hypothetical protein
VTRIDNCSGNQGVSDGTMPQGESGYNAISQDMIAECIQETLITSASHFRISPLATPVRALKANAFTSSERTVMET